MELTPATRAAIMQSVEDGFTEQIDYLRKLVSFTSQRADR